MALCSTCCQVGADRRRDEQAQAQVQASQNETKRVSLRLEWLLIVGAVAGLAALAVVLVASTVEETGERFAAPIPRFTAARAQAAEVVNDAKSSTAADFETWHDWEQYFSSKCARIGITINDDRISVSGNEFTGATGGGTEFDSDAALAVSMADADAPTTAKAQTLCEVKQGV